MEPVRDTAREQQTVPFLVRDPVIVWLAALLLSVVAASIAIAATGTQSGELNWAVIGATGAGQYLAIGGGVWLVCRRRGTGSLRRDVGFAVLLRDWWAVAVGLGIVIGFGAVYSLIDRLDLVKVDNQQVVEDLEKAGGAELAALAIVAVLLAPVFEELLFRGLLLRALQRRLDPRWAIGISGVAFGAIHLLDPSLGTLIRVPALATFGVVSSVQAVRTGSLSRSILLHVGFNLPAVLGAVFS